MFRYIQGDATEPLSEEVVIGHLCNDLGIWGKGFVMALSKRWSEPEDAYRALWPDSQIVKKSNLRGVSQAVDVSENVTVVNMIAMDGINTRKKYRNPDEKDKLDRIDYESLRKCLQSLAKIHPERPIQMPMIGNGLAGGDWERIESMIQEELSDRNVTIFKFQ